jgi:hypothetical protein
MNERITDDLTLDALGWPWRAGTRRRGCSIIPIAAVGLS